MNNQKAEKTDQPLAVCLVSGGLDSCVTAALAARDYRAAFLHVNYGQVTEEREMKAFNDIADYYRVPERLRLAVDIGYLKKIGGSRLTDPGYRSQREDGIPDTYVPFRNGNILSIAVSWAEVIGAEQIFIGAMEEDSSGYPDCREEFVSRFNRAIDAGTRPGSHIEVAAPIIHLSKGDVVRKGIEVGAPLRLSWSCYTSSGPAACGMCESCRLRLKGFSAAGAEDPIEYDQ